MNGLEREGFATVIGRLSGLGKSAVRVLRSGVRKGQNVLDTSIASQALKYDGRRVVNGHVINPGGLGNSIGSTLGRTRSDGSFDAKTGLAVGKTSVPLDEQVTKGKKAVSYGHWGIMGTVNRWTGAKTRKTKKGLRVRRTNYPTYFRGKVEPTCFVQSGAAAGKNAAETAVLTEVERQIQKQAES